MRAGLTELTLFLWQQPCSDGNSSIIGPVCRADTHTVPPQVIESDEDLWLHQKPQPRKREREENSLSHTHTQLRNHMLHFLYSS